MKNAIVSAAVLSLALTALAPAQLWTEVGDAGDLPGTAQTTAGTGAITQIDGVLPSGADVDMYLIRVVDPQTFTASSVGGATYDTQMWMFATNGMGISFKDDDGPLQSTLTGQFLGGPGLVLIAVSRYDNDAQDAGGLALWNDTPFAVERQPDGPGAANPVAQWGPPGGASGPYSLFLTGAEFADQPECWMLLGFTEIYAPVTPTNDILLTIPDFYYAVTMTNIPLLQVPNDGTLYGAELFFQVFLRNSSAYPNDPIKLSNGIRVVLGDQGYTYGPTSGMTAFPRLTTPLGGVIDLSFRID